MKKFIVLIMTLICVFGLVACDGSSMNDSNKDEETTSNSENIDNSMEENKTEEASDTQCNSDDEEYDIAVSYANWTDESDIYVKALNREKMLISSVMHLPIYKFDTLEELEQFKSDFGDKLSMDRGYNETPSFNEVTASYDEKFFGENTVMLVYVTSSSGSDRYGVNSVYCEDDSFCIYVEKTHSPEVGTDDMAGWFITVVVSDSEIADCNEFDAIYGVMDK